MDAANPIPTHDASSASSPSQSVPAAAGLTVSRSHPLSPSEESLFRAAATWAGDPIELAAKFNLHYSELLRWLSQPHITALLAQHDLFTARCQANRARAASTEIADTLTTDFHETQDPKERRRIAGPLLRARTPMRPITLRSRAGAERFVSSSPMEPTARAVGHRADRASDRARAAAPDLHTLPAHVADAWTAADAAITAFSHSPPRISKQSFVTTLTAYADIWESHYAPRRLATEDAFDNTQDARPLAQSAPSSSPSPSPRVTVSPSHSPHDPQSPIRTPQSPAPLTSSSHPTAKPQPPP
jgi:hypothetical protein